jgi:peroxiredoxin
MGQLATGARAPDFELKDADGVVHSLAGALKKGPVALIFYKSECPTCQFTLPYVQKIFEKIENANRLTLWAISEDDADETRSFARQNGLKFTILIDEYPYAVSSDYGLEFVPGIFVIASDGTISVSEFGFTKAGLNRIAGFEFLRPNDGLPATRPG